MLQPLQRSLAVSYMSVRELNANVSKALSVAEAGDDIVLTRNGKPFLRITREGLDDAKLRRRHAVAALLDMMEHPVDLGGPASYDERTA